jgi:acylphosphatase
MQRTTCYFSGDVQGVGFRYTVMNISQTYDVVGYVRNMSDGRVELVMEGDERAKQDMLSEVKQRMGDFIQEVDVKTSPATQEFTRFGIRH